MRYTVLTVLLAASVLPSALDAQIFAVEPAPSSVRSPWGLDFTFRVAQPVHGFADNVSNAFGMGSTVRWMPGGVSPLALRGDFEYLNYGNERQSVPLSSTVNRVTVDMNTSNNILVFSGGPELAVRTGGIRPYIHGFLGYSYFFTQSSVGDDDGGAFASTTNFDDGGFAGGGGAGVRLPFRARRTEISVDAGARFTRNGVRTYLREGDVIDQPDGSLAFTPRVTDADYWVYYLGVSLSFGRR